MIPYTAYTGLPTLLPITTTPGSKLQCTCRPKLPSARDKNSVILVYRSPRRKPRTAAVTKVKARDALHD
jgi:hypothetical protein